MALITPLNPDQPGGLQVHQGGGSGGGSGYTSSLTSPPYVHLALKVKGKPEQVIKFHALLKYKDADWPFTRLSYSASAKPKFCEKCGGLEYHRPHITPQQIKAAAAQAGLRKVTIKHYALPCK